MVNSMRKGNNMPSTVETAMFRSLSKRGAMPTLDVGMKIRESSCARQAWAWRQKSSPPLFQWSAKRLLRFSLPLCLLLLVGCPMTDSGSKEKPGGRSLEGVDLRLAVVDDRMLAAAVVRVHGEWNAQTGASFQVVEIAEKDLEQADVLPADIVLCPSHLLGVLAERQLLAPVPPRILRDAEWGGIFDLIKLRETACGDRIMAVPFGSPVFCCYYRPDLLEKLGRRPPRTWAEYQELAQLLADQKPSSDAPWCGAIEPLAPGWAGLVLLARAAPYAKHRDNYSTLFSIETMEPLIAGPPFTRALEELVAAAKVGPDDPFRYTPFEARTAFWDGQCGMMLCWPTVAQEWEAKVDSQTNSIPVGFCEIPGSRQVFNPGSRDWDTRADNDDTRVPLLSIAGRLGMVSTKSENTDAAFQLLLWLSDSRMSPQVCAASPATTLFRQSNLTSPGQWVEHPAPALAAVQYGDATHAALSHEQWLGALRIPGRAEYLAALDEAVAAALGDEKPPKEALLQADAKWRKVTERLGVESQRAAYRHGLGLD